MKVTVGTDKAVFAYRYVGEEVGLVTLVEGEETYGSEKDLEDLGDRRRDDKVNEYEVDETMCGVELRIGRMALQS